MNHPLFTLTRIGLSNVACSTFIVLSLSAAATAGPLLLDRRAEQPMAAEVRVPDIRWQSDYYEAMRLAKARRSMLFVYFEGAENDPTRQQFEGTSLADPQVRRLLAGMVSVRLPMETRVPIEGRETRLIDHAAFSELEGGPGAVLIDMVHRDADYYGHTVSALPLSPGRYYRFHPSHLRVMLDLPPGSITQRTLVFAVRIHPEGPASTAGKPNVHLVEEAQSHSRYQAQIRVQGHHFWERRFHRLLGILPFGLRAREVCAESWPNEKLVDAAVDCVDCWRQSSGHWSAVREAHPLFGYDMQRGSNGIWYATGVFGSHGN